jgi:hypothetical protein
MGASDELRKAAEAAERHVDEVLAAREAKAQEWVASHAKAVLWGFLACVALLIALLAIR